MVNKIFINTTDFFSINTGDEIKLGSKRYKIIGNARERRFGIEDPKFWVKRATEVETGEKKIIKLTFLESFTTNLAGVSIKCFRDPDKESSILELVDNHPYFMQGKTYKDSKQNNVRVIDVVRGTNYFNYIGTIREKYEVYFKSSLPKLLKQLIKAFEAIRFLHVNGFRHGDIRNDHMILENETQNLVWIDFDYDFKTDENQYSLDIFGLGNILLYTIGKGFHDYYMIKNDTYTYKDLVNKVDSEDFSLLDKRRLVNLRKLYPIIPDTLNNILLHFSKGANVYYEFTEEIIEDLNLCLQAFR